MAKTDAKTRKAAAQPEAPQADAQPRESEQAAHAVPSGAAGDAPPAGHVGERMGGADVAGDDDQATMIDITAVAADVPPAVAAWHALSELDEDAARRRFPKLTAALERWAQGAGSIDVLRAGPTLRVTSLREGFRRAGIAHPTGPVDHPAETLTPDQVELLLAEKMLVVEIV